MKRPPFMKTQKPSMLQKIALKVRRVFPITVLAQHEETIIYRDSMKLKRKYSL